MMLDMVLINQLSYFDCDVGFQLGLWCSLVKKTAGSYYSSHLATQPWVRKVGISNELIYLSILYSRPGALTEA